MKYTINDLTQLLLTDDTIKSTVNRLTKDTNQQQILSAKIFTYLYLKFFSVLTEIVSKDDLKKIEDLNKKFMKKEISIMILQKDISVITSSYDISQLITDYISEMVPQSIKELLNESGIN